MILLVLIGLIVTIPLGCGSDASDTSLAAPADSQIPEIQPEETPILPDTETSAVEPSPSPAEPSITPEKTPEPGSVDASPTIVEPSPVVEPSPAKPDKEKPSPDETTAPPQTDVQIAALPVETHFWFYAGVL